jgi:hypothetical protein
MNLKHFLLFVIFSVSFFSCSEDTDITTPRNLQEYITSTSSNSDFGEVIACAASASSSLSYIFYYPVDGATDIRYYEADSLNVDPNDFSNYRRKELTISDVFGGKLEKFSRTDTEDNWCLVTYMLDGQLHKSNTIRLKSESSLTGWTDAVTIDFTDTLTPEFTWSDFGTDNEIYFEVISEVEDDSFVSGTYTYDKFFKYFDDGNVVLDINDSATPDNLVEDTEYLFTMMAVSADNWVNIVIQETFIPRNLQEYLDVNTDKSTENVLAFAASGASSESLSYIYYYPLEGAYSMRYYETEGTSVDETDFSNYRRKNLTDDTVFGSKLGRFSRTDTSDSWCIVTYIIDEVLYTSEPIKIKIDESPTEWLSDDDVAIDLTIPLEPIFTWEDGLNSGNIKYFQVITDSNSDFLSGTFTTEKRFQYYDTSSFTSTINLETPEALILNDGYKITIMGLDADNWVNLMIQESFIVE